MTWLTEDRSRVAAERILDAAGELFARHGIGAVSMGDVARTATRDVELHGTVIPAGRRVLLLYGAANRDPRRYGPDADELDVRRRPGQLLTFSQGSHHCLGAAAARLQARVALEELLLRCPDFAVDLDGVQWAPGRYVRRPTTVPFRVAG